MEKRNDFLKKLATITDTIDKLKFGNKKIVITITFDKGTYNLLYKMFNTDDKILDTFTILMDEYEFVIICEI